MNKLERFEEYLKGRGIECKRELYGYSYFNGAAVSAGGLMIHAEDPAEYQNVLQSIKRRGLAVLDNHYKHGAGWIIDVVTPDSAATLTTYRDYMQASLAACERAAHKLIEAGRQWETEGTLKGIMAFYQDQYIREMS